MNTPTRRRALQRGAWFFLANAILALLISVRFMWHLSGVESAAAYVYLTFTTLSHFAALTFALYLLFYLPAALLVPRSGLLKVWAAVI
ncbi:MAG TPA: DUF3413 domain-containing protein, partial [Candidatus Deferrimicrobium sp.]|nr:DUF3413 domain-containing protein [Candidatus Deferrimicrobium sp.]